MFTYEKLKQKKSSKNTVQKKETEKPVTMPNLTGISDTTKIRFENLSGFSFDDVRVFYNSDKPAQLQSLAYLQGNQVHIATGQEKYLSHELEHVVQQKQGNIQPAFYWRDPPINDDLELERSTDGVVQKRVVREDIQEKEVVQLCNNCHNQLCRFGELCKYRRVDISHAKVKYYHQDGAATSDGIAKEWEHLIPGSVIDSLSTTPQALPITKAHSPVFALDRRVHRGGVSGSGGGTSSTGSSTTAVTWRQQILTRFQTVGNYEALKSLVIDAVNACRYSTSGDLWNDEHKHSLKAILMMYNYAGIINDEQTVELIINYVV